MEIFFFRLKQDETRPPESCLHLQMFRREMKDQLLTGGCGGPKMDNSRWKSKLWICSSRSALFVWREFSVGANKLSTNVSHYLISFRAWSLQCFIASRKSHHSVYILVFLLNPLPLLDAKVARSPRPSKRHPLFSIIKIFERFQALENWQQDFLICLTELRR